MMKDYIRKLLLKTARKAFFKKGFKAVSMREISKLSLLPLFIRDMVSLLHGYGISIICSYIYKRYSDGFCEIEILQIIFTTRTNSLGGIQELYYADFHKGLLFNITMRRLSVYYRFNIQ